MRITQTERENGTSQVLKSHTVFKLCSFKYAKNIGSYILYTG